MAAKKAKRRFPNIKKLIAMLLTIVIVVAITPAQATQATNAEVSLICPRQQPRPRFPRGAKHSPPNHTHNTT